MCSHFWEESDQSCSPRIILDIRRDFVARVMSNVEAVNDVKMQLSKLTQDLQMLLRARAQRNTCLSKTLNNQIFQLETEIRAMTLLHREQIKKCYSGRQILLQEASLSRSRLQEPSWKWTDSQSWVRLSLSLLGINRAGRVSWRSDNIQYRLSEGRGKIRSSDVLHREAMPLLEFIS